MMKYDSGFTASRFRSDSTAADKSAGKPGALQTLREHDYAWKRAKPLECGSLLPLFLGQSFEML